MFLNGNLSSYFFIKKWCAECVCICLCVHARFQVLASVSETESVSELRSSNRLTDSDWGARSE